MKFKSCPHSCKSEEAGHSQEKPCQLSLWFLFMSACWTPQRNLILLWADSLFMNTACGFSLCLSTQNVASVFCHVRSRFGFIKQKVRSHPWILSLSTFKKNSINLKGKQQTTPMGKKKHEEKVSESAGSTGRHIKEVSIHLWKQSDKEGQWKIKENDTLR